MTENELRQKVVDVMRRWLGAKQGSDTHKAILETYNGIQPLPRGVRMAEDMPWCAATVSAAFRAAGLINLIPAECSCGEMMRQAMARGIWVEEDGYRPQIGDIVMYDWQDSGQGDNTGAPDHVGVVVSVQTDYFWVVEGNMGRPAKVGSRMMSYDARFIRGFITPKYAEMAEAMTRAEDMEGKADTETSAAPEPWYTEAMAWAQDAGIMDGTRPLDTVTRAELATVAMRTVDYTLRVVRECLIAQKEAD